MTVSVFPPRSSVYGESVPFSSTFFYDQHTCIALVIKAANLSHNVFSASSNSRPVKRPSSHTAKTPWYHRTARFSPRPRWMLRTHAALLCPIRAPFLPLFVYAVARKIASTRRSTSVSIILCHQTRISLSPTFLRTRAVR